jgi:hypothetical protein
VAETSPPNFSISNKCYNNILYKYQCLVLPYIVRKQKRWTGSQQFKFNGVQLNTCQDDPCIEPAETTAEPTTVTQSQTTATASEQTQALNNLQDTVDDILNDLTNLGGGRRYKRNENALSDDETKHLDMSNSHEDEVSKILNELGNLKSRSKRNSFSDDEKELLEVMTNLITYMNKNCVPTTGICQASWINYYINQLKTVFNKIKAVGSLTPGYYNAFKTKHNSYQASVAPEILCRYRKLPEI